MKPKFIQIATGTYDNDDQTDFVLYALDSDGQVWYFSISKGSWVRMTDERSDTVR